MARLTYGKIRCYNETRMEEKRMGHMKSFKKCWGLLMLCMLICLAAQTVAHAEGTPAFNSLRELQSYLQDCIKERLSLIHI